MGAPVCFDVVPLLKYVLKGLETYARAHSLAFKLHFEHQQVIIYCDAQTIMVHFTHLLCQIINFLPAHKIIEVTLREKNGVLEVKTITDYMDLTRVHAIVCNNALEVSSFYADRKSCFHFSIGSFESSKEAILDFNSGMQPAVKLPHFYSEVGKRLRSHFTNAENLVCLLHNNHPREAQFLQKINAIILANLENESFGTVALCTILNMSRTQLFRKLKPLIRQAPACYIKNIRLQKAKQLLETTNYTVGEVTYKTGFASQSHFTKVFTKHYGVQPSLFKRK